MKDRLKHGIAPNRRRGRAFSKALFAFSDGNLDLPW